MVIAGEVVISTCVPTGVPVACFGCADESGWFSIDGSFAGRAGGGVEGVSLRGAGAGRRVGAGGAASIKWSINTNELQTLISVFAAFFSPIPSTWHFNSRRRRTSGVKSLSLVTMQKRLHLPSTANVTASIDSRISAAFLLGVGLVRWICSKSRRRQVSFKLLLRLLNRKQLL